MNNIDLEWSSFSANWENKTTCGEWEKNVKVESTPSVEKCNIPESSPNCISTQTHKIYLSSPIDLGIFWKIPTISYTTPATGVIKKEIKFATNDRDEFNSMERESALEPRCVHHVFTHIDNPNGRVKFKDSRKITVGFNKKNIEGFQSRRKPKRVFYNCIALTLRIEIKNINGDITYKDIHNKVFNTGKVEMPGIVDDSIFNIAVNNLLDILNPFCNTLLNYTHGGMVITKSNFNCGYYIHLGHLQDVLDKKYGMNPVFDPCTYRGVKCKFMYDPLISEDTQHGTGRSKNDELINVSFMVFRTGSVIIAGKCGTREVNSVYTFLKKLFLNEYNDIMQSNVRVDTPDNDAAKHKPWEALFGQNRTPILLHTTKV
jgi:hypothetical protein